MNWQVTTEKKLYRLKHMPYGGTRVKNLTLVTVDCLGNDDIITLLAAWRKKHAEWFPSQFPVTSSRTRKWLQDKVIRTPDRILFLVSVDGTSIGHVGLNRFDWTNHTCDIDNIVRGVPKQPGVIGEAIRDMMDWARDVLHVRGFTLTTSSDNKKALRLYNRLGFVETKRVPLLYKKNTEGGEWIIAPKEYGGKIKRYDVHMKHQKKLSFAGPSITKKEISYVIDGVKRGFYETFDKDIKALEKTTSTYVGTKYALAGFCATHSLHLACLVCGFGKGDEVIVTDFSWAATAHVIAYTGATPVFVDVEPDTWCIDPKAIEQAITKKTKGIMLVHSFGMPANMDAIMKIARTHKLKVIEDAAPALGSLYKGKKVGGLGDVGCISFHGAKIAASGEGGMFLTNNKKMLDLATLLSNMGRTNSKANFWCDTMGFEYQMANVTAALARAQVERIEELVAMKRKIFSWYWERLKDIPELTLLKEKEGMRSNYAYPAVFLNTKSITRDKLIASLRTYNIHAREAFPRMSRFPMYSARFANPVAARIEKDGFNLPSALNLTRRDVNYICDILVKLITQHS